MYCIFHLAEGITETEIWNKKQRNGEASMAVTVQENERISWAFSAEKRVHLRVWMQTFHATFEIAQAAFNALFF